MCISHTPLFFLLAEQEKRLQACISDLYYKLGKTDNEQQYGLRFMEGEVSKILRQRTILSQLMIPEGYPKGSAQILVFYC